jgi:hypothetical protein
MKTLGQMFITLILLSLIGATAYEYYFFTMRTQAQDSQIELMRLRLTVDEQRITDLTATKTDLNQKIDDLAAQIVRLKTSSNPQ